MDVFWSVALGLGLFVLGGVATWCVYRFRTRADRRRRRELVRQLDERFRHALSAGQTTPEQWLDIQQQLTLLRRG